MISVNVETFLPFYRGKVPFEPTLGYCSSSCAGAGTPGSGAPAVAAPCGPTAAVPAVAPAALGAPRAVGISEADQSVSGREGGRHSLCCCGPQLPLRVTSCCGSQVLSRSSLLGTWPQVSRPARHLCPLLDPGGLGVRVWKCRLLLPPGLGGSTSRPGPPSSLPGRDLTPGRFSKLQI